MSRMVRVRVPLVLLLAVSIVAISAAPAGAYIYWSEGQGNPAPLGRANLDGSGVEPAFVGLAGFGGIAVDGAHIYWSSGGQADSIARANLDGTGIERNFIPNAGGGLAVDATHIYWASPTGIGRANIDGSGAIGQFVAAHGAIAVAVDGAHIYWASTNGTIGRANLDGTSAVQSLIPGTLAGGIAVDAAHIYWTNFRGHAAATGTIGRANLDGTGVEQRFITTAVKPFGIAVDGAHVYWANDPDTIGRANLDGTGVDQQFIHVRGAGVDDLAVDALGPSATAPAAPPPVFGRSANVAPVTGTVLIRLPGSHTFAPLSSLSSVPLGTTVDTTNGTVQLTSATGSGTQTQTGRFHGGIFRLTQTRARSGVRGGAVVGLTVLTLAGDRPAPCPATSPAGGTTSAVTAKHRPSTRALWGDAHGNYQSTGTNASATVRGTEWLTEDTCAGTLIRVARGVVSVDDFPHHRTFLLHAGQSFLAHPGPGG